MGGPTIVLIIYLFLVFFGCFGGRDLTSRVGHPFSDMFDGIVGFDNGLGLDLRGSLVFLHPNITNIWFSFIRTSQTSL